MKFVKDKISIMFPGQGFQFVGMLNDFVFPGSKKYSEIIEIFNSALNKEIGGKLSDYMTLGKDESEDISKKKRSVLNETKVAQPAILLHSILNFHKFVGNSENVENYEISSLFGPSLGEIIALVIADSLTYEQGAKLLYNRGKFMQESCPTGEGSMLNVIGDAEVIINKFKSFKENNLNKTEREFIDVSSINSKRLVVLSGKSELIEKSLKFFKENSIACKKLPVSAAFHSKLMEKAQTSFSDYLFSKENSILFKIPKYPILSTVNSVDINTYSNQDENKFDSEVKSILIKQLREPVNLLNTVKFNISNNIDVFDMNKRKFFDNSEYI